MPHDHPHIKRYSAAMGATMTGRGGLASAVLVGVVCAASLPAFGQTPTSAAQHVRLGGNQVAGVRLGSDESRSLHQLRRVFGKPTHRALSGGRLPKAARHCGYTSEVDWRHLNAYFYGNRFVGYAVFAPRLLARNGSTDPAQTAKGLRVGDPLRKARRLYGHVNRSLAQGGSWAVHTSTGRLLGYSQATHRRSPILSIEAGHIGCTALAPQP
jgi:hypothetical protein